MLCGESERMWRTILQRILHDSPCPTASEEETDSPREQTLHSPFSHPRCSTRLLFCSLVLSMTGWLRAIRLDTSGLTLPTLSHSIPSTPPSLEPSNSPSSAPSTLPTAPSSVPSRPPSLVVQAVLGPSHQLHLPLLQPVSPASPLNRLCIPIPRRLFIETSLREHLVGREPCQYH
jgi:hypothetical protein